MLLWRRRPVPRLVQAFLNKKISAKRFKTLSLFDAAAEAGGSPATTIHVASFELLYLKPPSGLPLCSIEKRSSTTDLPPCPYLGDHNLLRARADAEKYLQLAVLNLAECVAHVGTQLQSK